MMVLMVLEIMWCLLVLRMIGMMRNDWNDEGSSECISQIVLILCGENNDSENGVVDIAWNDNYDNMYDDYDESHHDDYWK